jgi:WD40 repeat protein
MANSTLDRAANELEEIILGYLTAVDEGRAPTRHELLSRYPGFAPELEAFFADQDRTVSCVAPLRDVAPGGAAVPMSPSFGDYELLGEIGRGGMGVVFRAHQVSLDRPVALKMILSGHFASSTEVQRFQAEAAMGAQLNDPHIVPIYEVGEHEGRHFFSMKLMEGGSLADQIGDGRWRMDSPEAQRNAARLIATLARAVEHAHQRGLLHRDLKPGNILFDDEGRAHVSDFGLSKRVQAPAAEGPCGSERLTVSGIIVGTPGYMAPEQATAIRTVTTGADVYGLGAIFYELLTGRAPFQGGTPLETLRQVTGFDPPRPCGLNAKVDRDLETIALKCLEKNPRSRYASAAALAEDLERWLAGEPIRARPTGLAERALKWARRRPAAAALCGLIMAVFVGGLGAVVWNWQAAEEAQRRQILRAEREQEEKLVEAARADQEARDKRRLATKLYFKNAALARHEFADGNLRRADELLAECDADLRGWEWHFLDRYFHPPCLTLRQHTTGVVSLAFNGAGDRLATLSSRMHNRRVFDATSGHRKPTTTSVHGTAGALRVFGASDGRELLCIDPKSDLLFSVALSPDARSVACSGGTLSETGLVKVFDTTEGGELFTIAGHAGPVRSVAYSPDGRWLASASDDGTVKLWDAKSGQLVRPIADRDSSVSAVGAVAFSPDGSRLAGAIIEDATVRIWDTATGRQLHQLRGHTGNVTHVAFRPDGARLATGSEDRTVKVWEMDTGREMLTLAGHTDGVTGVAFSPDGARLASAGYDYKVHVWDAASGMLSFTLAGHVAPVIDVAWSPDGERLATASLDDTVKVWSVKGGQAAVGLRPKGATVGGIAFSPDGRYLARGSVARHGDVVIVDAATGMEVRSFQGREKQVTAVAYAPDGARLAAACLDNQVRVWETAAGELVHTLPLGRQPIAGAGFQGLGYSPDGKRLAAAQGETVKVWDTATGRELHDFHEDASSVAFSPDARRLAYAGRDRLKVRDAESGKEICAVPGGVDFTLFSPDGERLLALGGNPLVQVLDAETGKPLMVLRPSIATRTDLAALSPDGRRLALIDIRNVIRIWDTSSGEEALALPGHATSVIGLAFSPYGHRLASSDADGVTYIWDATPLR